MTERPPITADETTELGVRRRKLDIDVYTAARARIAWIFNNFERIYLSFSGGKDSGVLLNLVLQHMEDHNETRKLGYTTTPGEWAQAAIDLSRRREDQPALF